MNILYLNINFKNMKREDLFWYIGTDVLFLSELEQGGEFSDRRYKCVGLDGGELICRQVNDGPTDLYKGSSFRPILKNLDKVPEELCSKLFFMTFSDKNPKDIISLTNSITKEGQVTSRYKHKILGVMYFSADVWELGRNRDSAMLLSSRGYDISDLISKGLAYESE